ncbi:Hsp70 family protein [Modestobacter lapidis]|nr:Hsp70 family protein [Modestobacter lapidis]
MKGGVAYGIDFGTSNSSIAVAFADGSTHVIGTENRAPALRSLVYLNRDGNRLTGEDSVRAYLTTATAQTACSRCSLVDHTRYGTYTTCVQHRSGGSCRDSRLLAQVKRDLSSDHLDRTNSWTRDYRFTELVAVILKRLKKTADRSTGQDIRRVAIGRPVRFPGVEADPLRLQALAEERLREAAGIAGFSHVQLVPEPQAAVTVEGISDGLVVCTDFGGGTFDVAVLSKKNNRGTVLALGGAVIGGESFDSRLFDLKVRPALGVDGQAGAAKQLGVPGWLRAGLNSLTGCQQLLRDERVGPVLRDLSAHGGRGVAEALRELLYGGQAWACHQAVEQAKIRLSTERQARITLRRLPHLDLDILVQRSEFEQSIRSELSKVEACIHETLARAGVDPDQIAYVTRTGGSSRIPAFEAMLHSTFGASRVVDRDAFTTVVTGLARFAYAEWASSRPV